MRAVQFNEFGSADVLRVNEIDKPEPGPGQVRVAVRSASVNPADWKIRYGYMEEVFPVEFPHIPGLDLAGVVDAVGEGADFAVGDEVFGWGDSGSYADYALASALALKPEGLSWADAAALPVGGETALRVLGQLDVSAGETVLIHGASGAVGSLAVQLAVARGATVIGTNSEANDDYVRSLGAVPVRYGDGLVDRVRSAAPQGVDAVFDAAGFGVLSDAVELRGGTDRIVTVADPSAFERGIAFSGEMNRSPQLLAELADHVVAGKLRITHSESYPLEKAAEAHRFSETGHSRGKIILEVSS
ncbi:NADP-dependent oxidoreductase [Salininema proteolyticum]|uniref:NADP-dependent oxidoreductase n=1 Tax=Salininema proteolyticum TaxID=1607685 RepID=A0ABV8U1P3_9ACTN